MPGAAVELAQDLIITSGNIIQIESAGGISMVARAEGTTAFQFNYTQWSSTSGGTAPILSLRRSRGTAAAPAALITGDYLGAFNFRGYDGSAFFDAADIRIITGASTWAPASPGPAEHTARVSVWLTHLTGAKTETWRFGADQFRIGQGAVEMGVNYITTGGIKWGTAASQKQAWWNATPVVQPTGMPAAATDLATALTLVNHLRSTLLTLGLMA